MKTGILTGSDYRSGLLRAVLAGLILHLLAFLFIPPFEYTPYRMREKTVIDVVEMEAVPVQLDDPEEIVQPSIAPPVINDDADELLKEGVFPINSPKEMLPTSSVMPMVRDIPKEFFAFDKAPVLIRSMSLDYPELARMAGVEGEVLFEVLIGVDGRVVEASILHSSVTKDMEQAAISAVRRFVFQPAYQGAVPVPARMAVPVTFRLH